MSSLTHWPRALSCSSAEAVPEAPVLLPPGSHPISTDPKSSSDTRKALVPRVIGFGLCSTEGPFSEVWSSQASRCGRVNAFEWNRSLHPSAPSCFLSPGLCVSERQPSQKGHLVLLKGDRSSSKCCLESAHEKHHCGVGATARLFSRR